MLTAKNRTNTLLVSAPGAVVFAAFFSLIGSVGLPNSPFNEISTFAYAIALLYAACALAIVLMTFVHSHLHESKTTMSWVAVEPGDDIIESLRVGKGVIRTSVTGANGQAIIVAQSESEAPFVRRAPVHLMHVTSDLPAVKDLEPQAYQNILETVRRSRKLNGNGANHDNTN